jgi:thioesterase domain-containing protein/aryl carrier-like protein
MRDRHRHGSIDNECKHATFFPCVELNYADILLNLKAAGADAPALCERLADGSRMRITRGTLRERVASLASSLERLGVRRGDRIAAVMHNDAQAVVAALAVMAIGATLSSASPEMGADALLDRFAPLSPRLLFAHTAIRSFSTGRSPAANVAQLAGGLPSLEGIVLLEDGPLPSHVTLPVHSLGTLIAEGDATTFVWQCFPFDQPLFVTGSPDTAGKPKSIVHGAGGTLLEQLKEHRVHTSLRPGERLYFHTRCAWITWNWQLSALASGVEIVTYDGPIASVDTLWQLVADERVNLFGTSPAYLEMCERAALDPARQFDLSALRAMMSSGGVLHDRQCHWVREHVGDLPLQSISVGTDAIGDADVIRQRSAPNLAVRTVPPPGITREALEPYLRVLWENLFSLSPIACDDDFFDLGGDSLLAAELATHVHQATGRTISFATLLTAPTIARLTSVIIGDVLDTPSESRELMRAGIGAPLFVAHSITGSVMECRALINALQSPRPVYGLVAHRVEGNQAAQQDVAAMARRYVEQIRLVQKHGPYALFGFSFGGLIAMEIGQQLHQAGEKVDLLFMLDTHVNEHCLPWNAWLRHQMGFIARQWQTLRAMPAAQRGRLMRDKLVNGIDRVRLRLGRTARRPAPDTIGLPPMQLRVREAMRVAMTRYRPQPYRAGPILYVDAQTPPPDRADPIPLLRRLARAGLKVVAVEGAHSDMIVEPSMLAVARALDDAAQRGPAADRPRR